MLENERYIPYINNKNIKKIRQKKGEYEIVLKNEKKLILNEIAKKIFDLCQDNKEYDFNGITKKIKQIYNEKYSVVHNDIVKFLFLMWSYQLVKWKTENPFLKDTEKEYSSNYKFKRILNCEENEYFSKIDDNYRLEKVTKVLYSANKFLKYGKNYFCILDKNNKLVYLTKVFYYKDMSFIVIEKCIINNEYKNIIDKKMIYSFLRWSIEKITIKNTNKTTILVEEKLYKYDHNIIRFMCDIN